MPFVTEEIWHRLGTGESIMIAPWPERHDEHRDARSEDHFAAATELITVIRQFRKAHEIRDSMSLSAQVYPSPEYRETLESLRPEIERLAKVSTLELLAEPGDPTGCARVVVPHAQVLIPLAGILDPELERERLNKRLAAIEADSARATAKLANGQFVANAPAEIVEKERSRLQALQEEAAAIGAQLQELG
jgi:valyl-tRNA synthetase